MLDRCHPHCNHACAAPPLVPNTTQQGARPSPILYVHFQTCPYYVRVHPVVECSLCSSSFASPSPSRASLSGDLAHTPPPLRSFFELAFQPTPSPTPPRPFFAASYSPIDASYTKPSPPPTLAGPPLLHALPLSS